MLCYNNADCITDNGAVHKARHRLFFVNLSMVNNRPDSVQAELY